MEIQLLLARVSAALKTEQASRLCVESVLGDADLMGEVLSFYR